MGLWARPACCLGVAYSANYRKGKRPKYREKIGIYVIFFPLWQGWNREAQKYLVKCKRKIGPAKFSVHFWVLRPYLY